MWLVRSLFALALFAFVFPALAQTDAEKEKARQELEKKGLALLNQIGEEAASLKLPENRVYVLMTTGELLWKRDEKRARSLLNSAASEINQVFTQYDETDYENQQIFYAAQNLRQQMLHKVAQLDPEFALELLRQTRPPAVRAFLASNQPERFNIHSQARWQAKSDAQLEQNLAMQAAQKNPERAVKIAREALSRDLSHNIFSLIEQIKRTDEKAAAQITDEFAAKLLASDWSMDYETRSIALSFINQFAPPQNQSNDAANAKPAMVGERTLRDIAEKLAASYLTGLQNQQISASDVRYILPAIERFVPNRAAALRQKAEEMISANPQQILYEKLNKLQQDGTAEQILAEVENFPPEMRSQLYQTASNKIAGEGDDTRARQILESIPSKGERDNALRNFEHTRYYNAVNSEKLGEAYKIVAGLADERTKFEHLNNLALTYHGKKQPETAKKILEEARQYAAMPPADEEEMQRVLRLARTTAVISPERAFELLEPLVAPANELIAASATLGKFYKRSGGNNFREGEWVLQNSNAWGYNDVQSLQLLAEHDFDRLLNIANKFERSDVRLVLRLMAAQAALSKRPDNNSSGEIETIISVKERGRAKIPFN